MLRSQPLRLSLLPCFPGRCLLLSACHLDVADDLGSSPGLQLQVDAFWLPILRISGNGAGGGCGGGHCSCGLEPRWRPSHHLVGLWPTPHAESGDAWVQRHMFIFSSWLVSLASLGPAAYSSIGPIAPMPIRFTAATTAWSVLVIQLDSR